MGGKSYDIIVAGAGPVGLFLACELALRRASVLVLERDAQRESPWKIIPTGLRGLHMPSLEAFYRRGMLDALRSGSQIQGFFKEASGKPKFAGHFAGMMLPYENVDWSRWKYRPDGPSRIGTPSSLAAIESTLTDRAESLGVKILRGQGVTGLSQDGEGVLAETNKDSFRGRWLVGCDGGKSVVRKAAGFETIGTEPELTGYVTDCDLDHPERLERGFQRVKGGTYIFNGNGLYLLDMDGARFDRSQEVSMEHLQSVLDRIRGASDVKFTKLRLAATWTDRCKQATTYRRGRVLLAGDAAHIHSPLGGQGLNCGLGDAMNLGWKLSLTVQRENESESQAADLTLLDTYAKERIPVGAWVLEWTRAQIVTMRQDDFGIAAKNIIRDLMNTRDGTNLIVERSWGLAQRYDLGDAHELVGQSVPDFALIDGTRLGPRMGTGRGLLVNFENDSTLEELITSGGYKDQVDQITVDAKDRIGLRAVITRPDGVVAWVAEEGKEADLDAAKAALKRWYGS